MFPQKLALILKMLVHWRCDGVISERWLQCQPVFNSSGIPRNGRLMIQEGLLLKSRIVTFKYVTYVHFQKGVAWDDLGVPMMFHWWKVYDEWTCKVKSVSNLQSIEVANNNNMSIYNNMSICHTWYEQK